MFQHFYWSVDALLSLNCTDQREKKVLFLNRQWSAIKLFKKKKKGQSNIHCMDHDTTATCSQSVPNMKSIKRDLLIVTHQLMVPKSQFLYYIFLKVRTLPPTWLAYITIHLKSTGSSDQYKSVMQPIHIFSRTNITNQSLDHAAVKILTVDGPIKQPCFHW